MNGLLVDMFCGGGGTSCGTRAALGRDVDIAINHSELAIAVHKSNHTKTLHLRENVWRVRPLEVTKGRHVSLVVGSPDCRHFSVAKGGAPVSKSVRSLAWVFCRWAKEVRPDCFIIENVAEFQGWGPLDRKTGKPIKSRKGQTFRAFIKRFVDLGYVVDWRVLDASLYGTPQRRRRLFVIARCDGKPIVWPEPTHGKGLKPVRTAAEIIDWSLPVRSIFGRKKPLADKTMWRIAQGIRKFVIDNPKPFIIRYNSSENGWRGQPLDEPLTTIDTSNRFGIVDPFVVKVNHGKREARTEDVRSPLSTVTAKQRGHAIVVPSLVEMNHSNAPRSVEQPLGVVTTQHNRFQLVAPTLIQSGQGEREGQAARVPGLHKPLGTVVAGGQKHALVSAWISRYYNGDRPVVGKAVDEPLPTVTAWDHNALAAVTLATFRGTSPGQPGSRSVEEPLPTISAGGVHVGEVRAFLTAYCGNDDTGGQQLELPLRTVCTKPHLGLVTIHGVDYQIVDIGLRMLAPHELLAAQFGRFADTYDLSAANTTEKKVWIIGNSVCPELAEAIVRANFTTEQRAAA